MNEKKQIRRLAKGLAEKEAGSIENWITEDDRNYFIDGYIKGFEKNLDEIENLIKLHNAVVEGLPLKVDRENRIITIK